MDFVHLHLHTQYSVLDGAIKIKDTTVARQVGDETKYEVTAKGLMSCVKDLGQKAVAMTDHGVMSGVIEFSETAKNTAYTLLLVAKFMLLRAVVSTGTFLRV
jgi:DNA polymerase-3 subunit alpha